MLIVFTVCGLLVLLGLEMRHRLFVSQLNQMDNEIHRLDAEVVKLKEEFKEELKKKQDAETKKGFKLPWDTRG